MVSKVIAEVTEDTAARQLWRKKETELKKQVQGLRPEQTFVKGSGQDNGQYPLTIWITIEQSVLDTFYRYFLEVGKKLRNCFEEIPQIDGLRDFIKKVIELDDNAMTDILLGNFMSG